MRTEFEEQLNQLNQDLIDMSKLCTEAVEKAIHALTDKDPAPAKRVIENEQRINDYQSLIDQEAIRLIMRQQPVASDLRFLSAALAMNTDLERIGDQAEDISHLVLQMLDRGYEERELGALNEMAKQAVVMIEDSVAAFLKGDSDLAKKTCQSDDIMDNLFIRVRQEVIEEIKKGSLEAEILTDIMMVAKYMERIGDHATNIAESVYFSLTGEKIHAD
ncbi:phosphate signaling complex protein PhoU [Kallipyga massiliensis]|uniref:phosphate signaling complex protein PhoU n=1 Tax=Kallipyga massiliensis TaxID=1472764 RepID=UPI0026F16B84|nr:phosphate signaling complex protein PhoU [Kallipyga massiliensis]